MESKLRDINRVPMELFLRKDETNSSSSTSVSGDIGSSSSGSGGCTSSSGASIYMEPTLELLFYISI